MSALKRLEVIDKIAVDLQSRFVTTDINIYLAGFGIRAEEEQVSSKKTYVKNLLATQENDLIEQIALDLEIQYSGSINSRGNNTARPDKVDISQIWGEDTDNFRLFLSHLTIDKEKIGFLKSELEKYGISSFVAHEDIHPTTEWQIELEKALNSMDALAALLSEGFNNSLWTDQEVGWALGRGVVVIPLKRSADPYGFMGKYQALNVRGKNAEVIAKEIFDILRSNPKTKSKVLKKYKTIVVEKFINARSFNEANDTMDLLETLDNLEESEINEIKEALRRNSQLIGATNVQNKIDDYLEKYA